MIRTVSGKLLRSTFSSSRWVRLWLKPLCVRCIPKKSTWRLHWGTFKVCRLNVQTGHATVTTQRGPHRGRSAHNFSVRTWSTNLIHVRTPSFRPSFFFGPFARGADLAHV